MILKLSRFKAVTFRGKRTKEKRIKADFASHRFVFATSLDC